MVPTRLHFFTIYRYNNFHSHFQSNQSSFQSSREGHHSFSCKCCPSQPKDVHIRSALADPRMLGSVKKETSEGTIGREGIAKNQNAFS
jgi:protein required for attachment to host cells